MRLPFEATVFAGYEAGRAGLWSAGWLSTVGIRLVVDLCSTLVERRARARLRAKSGEVPI